MGPPGGGKGTISEKLMKDFGFDHLSSGDMLRSHVKRETELGIQAKIFMDEGHLVPDDLIIQMIMSELTHHHGKVLLDGFPRTETQARALDSSLKVDLAIHLQVPFDDIVDRISDRWVHVESGRVYSYGFNPPKENGRDDVTGEPIIRRSDDEPDKVRERLEEYSRLTHPLINYYKQQGILESYDGSNDPGLLKKDRRSEAIYAALKPFVAEKISQSKM